jgi:hypothetical protein
LKDTLFTQRFKRLSYQYLNKVTFEVILFNLFYFSTKPMTLASVEGTRRGGHGARKEKVAEQMMQNSLLKKKKTEIFNNKIKNNK